MPILPSGVEPVKIAHELGAGIFARDDLAGPRPLAGDRIKKKRRSASEAEAAAVMPMKPAAKRAAKNRAGKALCHEFTRFGGDSAACFRLRMGRNALTPRLMARGGRECFSPRRLAKAPISGSGPSVLNRRGPPFFDGHLGDEDAEGKSGTGLAAWDRR